MKTIRTYKMVAGWLWLLAVAALEVVIPLHFFAQDHTHASCNADDKNCCETNCVICDFDLFLGYFNEYKFDIQRFDVLISKNEFFSILKSVFISEIFNPLRAPPVNIGNAV